MLDKFAANHNGCTYYYRVKIVTSTITENRVYSQHPVASIPRTLTFMFSLASFFYFAIAVSATLESPLDRRATNRTPNGIKAGIAGGDSYTFMQPYIGWWYDW